MHEEPKILALEEGDPTKLGAGSDFGGVGSGSGLFRHKLSPGLTTTETSEPAIHFRRTSRGYGPLFGIHEH